MYKLLLLLLLLVFVQLCSSRYDRGGWVKDNYLLLHPLFLL